MHTDVIVLAGGRSSRLGGVAKAGLEFGGRTLLRWAVMAAQAAAEAEAEAEGEGQGGGRVVVVGPGEDALLTAAAAGLLVVREEPPFGGPAAGIAAGRAALVAAADALTVSDGCDPAALVVVLACDQPRAGEALPVLLASARLAVGGAGRAAAPSAAHDAVGALIDGWAATDRDGRRQWLLAVYRSASLDRRIAEVSAQRPSGDLDGVSASRLLETLAIRGVSVPTGSTDDVDTWNDVSRLRTALADAASLPESVAAPPASRTSIEGRS